MLRIFFDTEFTTLNDKVSPDLISAGFVCEDGRQEWYCEISNFDRFQCSSFVRQVVLPLLDAPLSRQISGAVFPLALCDWLTGFAQDLELVADHPIDCSLIDRYCRQDFNCLPFSVTTSVWYRPGDSSLRDHVEEVEAAYWLQNPGRQHHALWDAHRLRVIVEHAKRLGYEMGKRI